MENNSKLMRKRPEMARYKPGMGKILAKKLDIPDNNDSNRPKSSSSDTKSDANHHRISREKSVDITRYSDERNDAKNYANNQNQINNKGLNKKPDILVYDSRKHDNSNRMNSLRKNDSNNSCNRDKDREKTPVYDKQRNNSNYNYNKQDLKEQKQQKGYRDKLYGNKTHLNRNTKENYNSLKISETNNESERKDMINDSMKRVENYVNNKTDFINYDNEKTCKTINQSVPKNCAKNETNKIDTNNEHEFATDNKISDVYDNLKANKSARPKNNHTINNNENKLWNSTGKNENSRHRSFSSNKSQHRYEQQIPPRFLKQQQLLKKMENEKTSQSSNDVQNEYHQQNHNNNDGQQHPQHRGGLIRLPPSSTLNPQQDMNSHLFPNTGHNSSSSHSKTYATKPSANTSKPCVAIRPTPHVSSNNFQPYSPSSSPETTALYSYQQMNSYIHTNFSDHSPLTPSMLSTSVGENESRLQNTPDSALSRKKWKPNVEKSYTEAVAAENDLHLCLIQSPIDQQKLEQLRYRIQLRYEHIILSDLRVCAEYNIEQRLWKAAFYQFIEHYRRLMEQTVNQQDMKTAFNKIVDEATLFFENLLVKMQETYNFCIEKLLSHEYDRETANYDTLKLAAISAQKINLYMGDLSRYKEVEIRNSNFSKSKFFYNRAQMLAPKNGRSYNQLALLAMYQNRRLDAVYYYMRSLAASNPFLTARENLLAIFDEVRRKYELADKKRKQDIVNSKRNKENECLISDNERIEIWIRPDGTSNMCSNYANFFEEESGKQELDMLSSVDLNKRFVLSFLHVHGKLFSKVGMDSAEFIPVVNQMLLEFHCLLRRSPIPVSSLRLLQLLAINMFAVFHTSLKDASYGTNCRSLLQEQAIQVTFAMISSILECANGLLSKHLHINTQPNFNNDDLSEILPTIKIWTDWMSCQKHLWCPPPPPTEFNLSCDGDIWTVFAEFLTLLTRVNVREIKLLPNKLEGCESVILPEDTQLAGFLPLLGSPQCVQFAQPPYDKEKAKTCLRITVIQFFGDYLCGIVDPYLKFDVERKRFVSLIPTLMSSNVDETNEFNCNYSDETSENENDDLSIDSSSVDTASNYNIETNSVKSVEQTEIEILWSRKEALRRAKHRQEIIKQRVDAVLNEENQRNPSRIIIQPRYIIPDTNCFIDHLPMLRALINSKFYDLIVPLIVINELNGLKSRGIKTNKPLTFTDDHEGHVGNAAMETIEYLMKAFSEKQLRLRAITSKGNLLDNINFTSESFSDSKGNSNDDFILNACLRFIKDKPSDKAISHSESKSIFREVVLLTDDRNLRIKALSHNVPVKSLPLFLKWANIPVKR